MASKLVHYKADLPVNGNAWVNIGPLTPANKALVVSKITVTKQDSTAAVLVFDLSVDVTPTVQGKIANQVSLALGEVYVESGVVIPAGERLHAYITGSSGSGVVQLFGEEVDN